MSEAATWYEASWILRPTITPVQVQASSKNCVWIDGRKRLKVRPSLPAYFKTWEEAREHLALMRYEKIAEAEEEIRWQQARLAEVNALTPPEEHQP